MRSLERDGELRTQLNLEAASLGSSLCMCTVCVCVHAHCFQCVGTLSGNHCPGSQNTSVDQVG